MSCNCIAVTNDKDGDLVKKYHTRIGYTDPKKAGTVAKILIKTALAEDAPKHVKPITIAATFCPLCGQKYPEDEEVSQ